MRARGRRRSPGSSSQGPERRTARITSVVRARTLWHARYRWADRGVSRETWRPPFACRGQTALPPRVHVRVIAWRSARTLPQIGAEAATQTTRPQYVVGRRMPSRAFVSLCSVGDRAHRMTSLERERCAQPHCRRRSSLTLELLATDPGRSAKRQAGSPRPARRRWLSARHGATRADTRATPSRLASFGLTRVSDRSRAGLRSRTRRGPSHANDPVWGLARRGLGIGRLPVDAQSPTFHVKHSPPRQNAPISDSANASVPRALRHHLADRHNMRTFRASGSAPGRDPRRLRGTPLSLRWPAPDRRLLNRGLGRPHGIQAGRSDSRQKHPQSLRDCFT